MQGLAVGIGTTMLLHCDFVVAATDARFSPPFVSLGLVPEAASSLLAPRADPHRRAFALLVMGRALEATTAQACGSSMQWSHQAMWMPTAMKAARETSQPCRRRPFPWPAGYSGAAPDELIVRVIERGRGYSRSDCDRTEARDAFGAVLTRKR